MVRSGVGFILLICSLPLLHYLPARRSNLDPGKLREIAPAAASPTAPQPLLGKVDPRGRPPAPPRRQFGGAASAAGAHQRIGAEFIGKLKATLAKPNGPGTTPLRGAGRGYGREVLNPRQQQGIRELLALLGPDTELQLDATDSTLRHLRGELERLVENDLAYQLSSAQGDYAGMSLAVVSALSRVMNVTRPAEQFAPETPVHDELGMTHVTLNQQHQGLTIYGAQAMVHFDARGRPVQVNGVYAPASASGPPVVDTLTPDRAIALAWRALGKRDPGLRPPRAEKKFYWDPNVTPVLAYQVDLVPSLAEYWHVFLSAADGSLIHQVPGARSGAVTGQSPDLLGVSRTVGAWQEGSQYLAIDTSQSMYDAGRSRPPAYTNTFGAICIFDVKNQDVNEALNSGVSYVQAANVNQWDPTAVSVMESFKRTFQYFKATHNRNSYDDKGINITGLIHARFKNPNGELYNDNAFFNPGLNLMVFGDGERAVNPGMLPAAVDITAHELSHGVVDNSAAFKYENQSGALHEHMADFFACMVDREDWIMGEDSLKGTAHDGWRDMSDPHNPRMSSPGPKTMAEYKNLPNTAQGDYGGVHVNSTIPSYATYLIAAGPQGLGREKTEKIVYRALTKYMTQNSGFIEYRRAAISAAKDLYPNGNEAAAVAQAFDAIQLYEAEAKPPPTPVPPTSGEELVVFLRGEVDPFFGDLLGYGLYVMSAQGYQVIASQYCAATRPAVSGDGEWALYLSEDNDVYITDGTRDEQLTNSGEVRAIAMTKDHRYVAFTTVDYDNTIGIIDINTEEVRTATLSIPTSGDEVTLSYADVMSFNCTGDTLYFDAWSDGKMGQTEYGCWGLFSMRLKDLACRAVLPLSPGLQVGNPSLAHTLPHVLLADYVYTTNGQQTVGSVVLDLSRNQMNVLLKGLSTYATATFRGDDTKIVYQTFDGGLFYLNEAALTPDRTALAQGSAKALLWSQTDLLYPVGFRQGAYNPPVGNLEITPATVDFNQVAVGQTVTNALTFSNTGGADLDLIEVSLENGEVNSYDFGSAMENRIPAGGSQRVLIQFHPGKTGPLPVTLRVKTTVPGKADVTIRLTGTGTAAPTQDYWRQVWQDFQDYYSYFDYKQVDWNGMYARQAAAFSGLTPDQFAVQLNEVLQSLHDWHVTVRKPDGAYLGYNGAYERNYSTKFYNGYTGGAGYVNVNNANVLWHAFVSNNIAYVVVDSFSNDRFGRISDADLDQVFATYANAAGMVIDFRSNSGGAEDNAKRIASRLIQNPALYGYVRYRVPKSSPYQFDNYLEKVLQPSTGVRFLKPVVGLLGQRCMSSAEWFTLMLRNAPNAILIGDHTRGASGNPLTKGIPALNIEYDISQWIAYTESKTPFEDKGIGPAVAIPPQTSFDDNTERDYVLEKAIAYIRWREALGARLPLVSAATDSDQDGIPDVAEFVAGSDPLAGGSGATFGFRRPGITRNPGGGFTLHWDSQAGQVFNVLRSPEINAGYSVIASNLPATPPLNQYSDPAAGGAGRSFYRLQRR
jgi:Zn-dependent metalloprotease